MAIAQAAINSGATDCAAQMAQLSADIVWLVEQDVTLADGSRQKALVPQVYVRVKDGDLAPSGALLAGSSINLNLTGDLTNSGTIAGRSIVSLTADNVHNLGGRIMGDTVAVTARQDLNNLGGQITAGSALMAAAGRDINVQTTTSSATNRVSSSASNNTFSHTGINRVAGLYVTNPGGTLVASAGRDLNIIGGIVANGPIGSSGLNGLPPGTGAITTPPAITVLAATRNLNLGVVTTSSSSDMTRDAQNYLRDGQSQDIGTQIRTAGNVALQAGQDLNAKAATVRAAGSLTVSAGNNVNLTAGQSQSSVGFGLTKTETGFFSSTSTTERRSSEQTQAVGSRLSGNTVTVVAGNDIRVTGSSVASEQATTLIARNNVIIEAAQNTAASASFLEKKESGLMFNGSLSNPNSLGIDLQRGASSDTTQSSLTQVGSSITSANGPTTLIARQGVLAVIASDIKAGAGKDLSLQGAQVLLSGGLNSQQSTSEQTKESTNIHLGVVKPSEGIFSRGGAKEASGQATLAATTLSGGNISIQSTGTPGLNPDGSANSNASSGLTLAGVKVTTPGTLSLDSGDGKLALNLIQTTTSVSEETRQRDLAYQKAQGAGASSTEAQYNELTYGKLTVKSPAITIEQAQTAGNHGAAIPKTLAELASQPGLGWIADVQRQQAEIARTNPAAALHIQNVKLAHEQWDYKQQGLTKEGAVIVAVVVAYFTAGAASGVGATAGNAAAVGASEGVALAGGGTMLTGTGALISTVVGGAVTAGLTTLATQASVSLINNQGDLGATLKDLGSKESVKALVTAVVTGGVLAGMNTNFSPTGQPMVNGGAQTFTSQLGQNLQAGIARSLVSTAINGGSLEDGLKNVIVSALIDTSAAQGAFAIGQNFTGLANTLAHALAGCAAGAARAGSDGCAPGALGAALGELAAEAYGKRPDTVEFAAMISGIGAALAGGDAAQISLASSAGANAAANNYLSHTQATTRATLEDRQRRGQALSPAEQQQLDSLNVLDIAKDLALRDACKTAGDACNAARRDLNASMASYSTPAATGNNAQLSPAGNAGVTSERDQNLQLVNDPALASQTLTDSFLEFAVPQVAGYAIGGVLGLYMQEARAIYAAIKTDASLVGVNGGVVNPALINELATNGVKFTRENIVATTRSPSGQIVFLETGNSRAGLQHIIGEHGNDFAIIGVSQTEIPSVVMQAVTQGRIVGYQGVGTGRPIFETVINGQPQRIAVTVSNNGFVVGANPVGSVK